jgi:hypothetical protein
MKLPRIPKGKGYLGPEYFGCCGTGRRPAIFHSINGKWVVGPELSAREAIKRALHYGNKRSYECNGPVMVRRTKKAAIAAFTDLCETVENWNLQQRREYETTREKAKSGDMAAVLKMGDF